ncbi:MAG: hypothetical protein AAGI25_14485 [Bacteroidota bacterium]
MSIDNKHKFIDGYLTTDAALHDAQALDELLSRKDQGQDLPADSAHTVAGQVAYHR